MYKYILLETVKWGLMFAPVFYLMWQYKIILEQVVQTI